jgi:hypothetical protein
MDDDDFNALQDREFVDSGGFLVVPVSCRTLSQVTKEIV